MGNRVPRYYKTATIVYIVIAQLLLSYIVYDKHGIYLAMMTLLSYPVTAFLVFMLIVFPIDNKIERDL